MSQLELALEARVSQKHVSFIESGRVLPRDRNALLNAAGFAPVFRDRPLLVGADPSLLAPPVNVMRLSLHPRGLAPLIANLPEWRAHLIEQRTPSPTGC